MKAASVAAFVVTPLLDIEPLLNLLCDTLNLLVTKQDEVSIFNNHFNIKYIVNDPE